MKKLQQVHAFIMLLFKIYIYSMKKAVFVSCFLLFAVTLFAQDPEKGSKAKEINLPGLEGKNVSLTSLQGKVVLIDFWASWCVPCRKTVPALKKLYSTYKDKGFEIFGVSLDTDANDWKAAVKQDIIPWTQVLDTSGETAGAWNVNYIPRTFLLDKQGKIIAVNPTEEELQKQLQKLLL